MALEKSDVEKIAHLARLHIDATEAQEVASRISSILDLIDQMQLLTIVGLLLLTGASLLLTNLAEKSIPPARATRISQRLGFAWIAALVAIEVVLVLVHRA